MAALPQKKRYDSTRETYNAQKDVAKGKLMFL